MFSVIHLSLILHGVVNHGLNALKWALHALLNRMGGLWTGIDRVKKYSRHLEFPKLISANLQKINFLAALKYGMLQWTVEY